MSKAISYETVVVEAMDAFLNSTDVRSAIQNAIARGGDISARAIIAGSIAEGFYGMSYSEKEWCNRLLPESMLEVLDRFDKVSRRNFIKYTDTEEDLTDELIENAIRQFNKNDSDENRKRLMNQIYYGMRASGNLRIPLVVPDKQKIYDENESSDAEYLTHQTADGKTYVVAFTNDSPKMCEKYPDIYLGTIEDVLLELADDNETSGIILNPDDDNLRFVLEKEDFEKVLDRTPPENKMYAFDGSTNPEFSTKLYANAVVTSDCEDFKNISFENFNEITAVHFMTGSSSCTIYTPLMFYSGTDEEIFTCCYFSCLELAKKYHLSSVFFPKAVFTPLIEKAVWTWLKMNEGCGMTVFIEIGDDNGNDTDDNDRNDDDIADDNDQDSSPADYRNEPITETNSVNSAKATAYRNLVERAKRQYPEYRVDIKPTSTDKQRTREFAANFSDKKKFWKALQCRCAKWEKSTNNDLNDERARESLTIAIANGFDPNDPVALFAPIVNGVNICNEINLYTYW